MHQTLCFVHNNLMTQVYPPTPVFTLVLNHVISHTPFRHLLIGYTFLCTSLSDLSKISLLVTKLDTRFLILVLAFLDLSDQELSIALEEFERTMVDASDLSFVAIEKPLRPNYNLCGC